MHRAKKIISVIVISLITLSILTTSFLAESNTIKEYIAKVNSTRSSRTLKFNEDGKFKIVVYADTQDTRNPYKRMIELINESLDIEKPDLVVFTGDNTEEVTNAGFKRAIEQVLKPVNDRNIPYAYTYGNHDAEFGVDKDYQYGVYHTLGDCLTYDADPTLMGVGNCNIPIYASKDSSIAFNLWIIDSNMYKFKGIDRQYDNVHQDQLDWYKKTSIELEKSQGKKVNSILFQHIALPEIYNLIVEDPNGSKQYLGKKYRQELTSNAHGYLGEFSCPAGTNSGEFDVLKERGDVIGIVTGHDHSNSFVGSYNGIDFIQMPGMTFHSYGDDNCRGYGVIELDERDTTTYESRTVTYESFWNGSMADTHWRNTGYYSVSPSDTYISDIKCAQAVTSGSAKKSLEKEGYTVIDQDLNANAKGKFIYMGYKTTNDYKRALRDIRFYSCDKDAAKLQITSLVNDSPCNYTRVGKTDLNDGAGGDYIYTYYSRDEAAGLPIKSVDFHNSIMTGERYGGKLSIPTKPADLNKGAGGDFIYCHINSIDSIDISALEGKIANAKAILSKGTYIEDSKKPLNDILAEADAFVTGLKSNPYSSKSQFDVDALGAEIDNAIKRLMCKVVFCNYDNTELETVIVSYGTAATCSVTPEKAPAGRDSYQFNGWSQDVSAVYDSMTVVAQFTKIHDPIPIDEVTTALVNNGFIYGLRSNLDVSEVNSYFNEEYVNLNTRPSAGNIVGTNSVISVTLEGVQTNYTAVIFGDVNSDGWYDGMDSTIVSCLSNNLLSKDQVTEAEYMAADTNHDGIIDFLDVDILNEAGARLSDVDQTKTNTELVSNSSYVEYLGLIDQNPDLIVVPDYNDTDTKPENPTEPDEPAPEKPEEKPAPSFILDFINKAFEKAKDFFRFIFG